MTIFQDLRTWRFWRHLLTRAFAIIGLLSTLMQTAMVIYPALTVFQGTPVLCTVAAVALIGGLIWSWPRPIAQDYEAPKTRISIVQGDLLRADTHLVIGTNDTFDTATPNIIALRSLQGQALTVLYGGDVQRLDAELAAALAGKNPIGTINKPGKQNRYGVGAIATLAQAARLIFFLAYCEMDANNAASSTPDKVWASLLLLWKEISLRGNGGPVSVPVIGGGLARLSSVLPAQDAIRFTVLSFMMASRTQKICDELRIVVRPEDYRKLDRLELQAFLSSLRAS
jgi:hypothetical protein